MGHPSPSQSLRRRVAIVAALNLGYFGIEFTVALAEFRLTGEQLGHLGFHELLVEQLTAGDTINLGSQRGDTVLVSVLHTSLARYRCADQVIAEDKV